MAEKNNSKESSQLRQVRESLHMKQKDFAEKLGITQSYLSAVELGKKEITTKLSKKLIELFQVSSDWLMRREGSIFRTENGPLISNDLAPQFGEKGVFSPKNSQNNSLKIGGPSENEAEKAALRERRLTALWNQVINRGQLDMTGYHTIGFCSVMGNYSDAVLNFIYKKADEQVMQVLGQVLDGKLAIHEAPSKINKILAPLNDMQSLFMKLESTIIDTMVSTLQQYPEAQQLIKGAPFYVTDLFSGK